MSDPHTFQIPGSPQLQPEGGHDAVHLTPAEQAEFDQLAENAIDPEAISEAEVRRYITQIGYLGDWVVYERTQYLNHKLIENAGVQGLWRKLGGPVETDRTLANKEAELSTKLFKDHKSKIFFFDKIGEGHGEWVLQVYPPGHEENPAIVYYEVSADQGRVLAKFPNEPYRLARAGEITRLHQTVSRYYELIKRELYPARG